MSFADAPSRDRLGFLMVTLTRQWRRLVEEQLAASGLTDATWTPLIHLRAWGDGVTQKELAERVGLDGSSLVRLLDILEGHGWVERRADAADRRSKRIFLTAGGNAAVDRIRATMLQAELSMLQDLDDAEVEAMLGSVNKIRARMEQLHVGRDEERA
ncbi:MarR family winged helix-turn-helix transcriptional regulator [Comamonas guangdongensis]|uniref:MarR family winged helix-turn-helix transcriptional regulator n=1 Tax=Comamonas guangdongensis TaxID=510515 RepID=A0ABV3ZXB1_9BURK